MNQMGKKEGEEEGILRTDMFGKVTLDDLDYSGYDVNDDDSNRSDKSYLFNEDKFDAELDNENKLNEQQGIGNEE